MGLLIKSDGTVEAISPKNGSTYAFENELYPLLGTDTIEVITLNDGSLMLLDENAKLRFATMGANTKATDLLHKAGGMPDDIVIGDAVIINSDELG
jgi:hypothetical protein